MNTTDVKRPTAQECLQYHFFRVAVPIPINAPDQTSAEDVVDALLAEPVGPTKDDDYDDEPIQNKR